eukprot:CAMPEP_0118679024 /NCGR_PEP_ID=MMETSP0800-20121206/3551_1 /TAXON_ID=210618 ORGANISM="Striatella unipunctata, Strain CCMP2910" /NCGR_SAMPLE_ID=MMETSP0800 /ASSEMBLY_ACC=CAM_ASM_000638 /LENGTH=619 /DNA_ID=CAMNT_0006574959 /DNA_START=1 /DNA_END=1860 /DNA_ORIENTATION=+
MYDDSLKVGTLKFAMLDMIRSAISMTPEGSVASMKETEPTKSDKNTERTGIQSEYLQFFVAILAHFFFNRKAVLSEVHSWCSTASVETEKRNSHKKKINELVQVLERLLLSLPPPTSPTTTTKTSKVQSRKVEDDERKPSGTSSPVATSCQDEVDEPSDAKVESASTKASASGSLSIDDLRRRMQEAASSGDFIGAGKIQEQIKLIEDLEQRMKEAAAEGNFIRAGRLQEQLEALLQDDKKHKIQPPPPIGAAAMPEHLDMDDSDSFEDMDVYPPVPPPPMAPSPFGPQGFSGIKKKPYHPRYGRHSWGTGNTLGGGSLKSEENDAPKEEPLEMDTAPEKTTSDTISTTEVSKEVEAATAPKGPTCELRFRLPGASKSITEVFGPADKLSEVYRRVDPIIQDEKASSTNNPTEVSSSLSHSPGIVQAPGMTNRDGTQMVGVRGGAFAQPLSARGFTLLMAHPKREFSLEMHGTKTLEELGLMPSAFLTVMMCADRGVVRRGDLESRLAQAQGNSMDVEGLTYEGLLELTERVGVATTGDVDQEVLNRASTLCSPVDYLSQAGSTIDFKCPICLGEFDKAETDSTLRQLNKCKHTFHVACLGTWLTTKSSCPVCKQSLNE